MPGNINCIPLRLPPCRLSIRPDESGYGEEVFDACRGKYVRLTPEEWVRQHFVNYLENYLDYPHGLIANEVEICVGHAKKRCDTIVYDNKLSPRLLLEYKAPQVSLSPNTVRQVLRYNLECRVPLIILSNGLCHMAFGIDYETNKVLPLSRIPTYKELISGSFIESDNI